MNTISEQSIAWLKSQLDTQHKICIISHRNPDGDALGSSLALYHYLKNKGKECKLIMPNSFPDYYNWMPGADLIVNHFEHKNRVERFLQDQDLIVFLDFNVLNRTADLEPLLRNLNTPKILIDHHPEPENFADVIISDTNKSSTAELLFRVLEALEGDNFLNKDMAACLYTGVITDTGALKYNSSHKETYEVVGELLSMGLDKEELHSNIYDNFSESRMRLLGYCLSEKLRVFPEYQAAYISITREELKRFNFKPGDSEGFVNYPLSIQGVVFSAIFIEHEEYVKISFRSKGDFPANRFSAENFNGGGHVNAAGGESLLNIEDTLNKFENLLPNYKHLL